MVQSTIWITSITINIVSIITFLCSVHFSISAYCLTYKTAFIISATWTILLYISTCFTSMTGRLIVISNLALITPEEASTRYTMFAARICLSFMTLVKARHRYTLTTRKNSIVICTTVTTYRWIISTLIAFITARFTHFQIIMRIISRDWASNIAIRRKARLNPKWSLIWT